MSNAWDIFDAGDWDEFSIEDWDGFGIATNDPDVILRIIETQTYTLGGRNQQTIAIGGRTQQTIAIGQTEIT